MATRVRCIIPGEKPQEVHTRTRRTFGARTSSCSVPHTSHFVAFESKQRRMLAMFMANFDVQSLYRHALSHVYVVRVVALETFSIAVSYARFSMSSARSSASS